MKADKNKSPRRQPNLMLRFAAGAYLIFLAWDMIKQYLNDPDKQDKLIFLLIGIFFGLIGIYLAIVTSRRYYRESTDNAPPSENSSENGNGES